MKKILLGLAILLVQIGFADRTDELLNEINSLIDKCSFHAQYSRSDGDPEVCLKGVKWM